MIFFSLRLLRSIHHSPSTVQTKHPPGIILASLASTRLRVETLSATSSPQRFAVCSKSRGPVIRKTTPLAAPWQATSRDIRLTQGGCRQLSFLSLKLRADCRLLTLSRATRRHQNITWVLER